MLEPDLKVEALDVYCGECRRPYDDVADQLCEAAESNEHLRGGPVNGERAKRRHRYHNCDEVGCFPHGVRYGDEDDDDDAQVVNAR